MTKTNLPSAQGLPKPMIHTLKITHLRNLTSAHLSLADCNIFIGENGSGKTSLLEAVFLLSRGKTFRHHEPKRYISHHQRACTVWAKTHASTLAISKTLDNKNLATTTLKLGGQNIATQSPLSYALPVLPIDPSGMSLLEEGSQTRRQMLDWLAFHVKPEFYGEWLTYQRLLKQRNLLLKSPNIHERVDEVQAWDYQLVHHANRLHECRLAVFDLWQKQFKNTLASLLPTYQDNIHLSYQAGFDEKVGLLAILHERLHADIELGYTRVGVHRADVVAILKQTSNDGKIRVQAVDVLSRGEKKLLITALKLAQLQVICEHGAYPVVLIDDIDAELDHHAINKLLNTTLTLPCQLIMTSLQTDTAKLIAQKIKDLTLAKSVKMFHVKQGQITETTDDLTNPHNVSHETTYLT